MPAAARRRFLRLSLNQGLGWAVLIGVSGALGGCGLRLRQRPALAFQKLYLQGFRVGSPLELALRSALPKQLSIVPARGDAQVVLLVLEDRREKSVAASTSAGQVRDFQLRLRFRFQLTTPTGRVLTPPAELVQSRDLSWREDLALGKMDEEDRLYQAMQDDIVDQVLWRMSGLKDV